MFDRPFHAALHLQKGRAGLAHLARATRPERHVAALAELLGGAGEPQDRADLVAQERGGDGENDDRRRRHPDEENMGVRRISLRARRENLQIGVVEGDADFDEIRVADRCVDPEGMRKSVTQFPRERVVEQREEWLWLRRRKRLLREDRDLNIEIEGGDPREDRVVLVLREALVDVDHRRDVARDMRRESIGDGLPVALDENIGDRRLQQHDRQDDDQQRPRI